MKSWKNSKMVVKLLLITVPIDLIFTAYVFFSAYGMRSISKESEAMFYDEIHGISNALVTADRDMYQAQLAVAEARAGVESGKGIPDYALADYQENAQQSKDAVAKLEGLFGMDSYLYNEYSVDGVVCSASLGAFKTTIDAWDTVSKAAFSNSGAVDWDEQNSVFLAAREHLNEMEDVMDAYAEYQSETMLRNVQSQSTYTVLVLIVILLCSTALNVVTIHYLRVNINQVKDIINRMADNDLTTKPPVFEAKDEIGALYESADKMFDNLRAVIGNINESSERVSASGKSILDIAKDANQQVEAINTAINEMAITANTQATDITNIATNMSEIGDLVQESGRFSENLAEESNRINGVTKEGMEVVSELLDTTDETMKAFEDIFELVHNISASVVKIGEASHLISDIASQTNLLSLNASIEAARAGEAGRGFAVVASEISSLADQSAQSANTINQMIEELQSAAELANNQGEEVKKYVDAQSDSVKKTQEKFENIVTSVDEMNNGIKNIAAVNKEMGNNFTNVNDLISSLSAASEQNAANSQEIAATTESVSASMANVNSSSQEINAEAEALVEAVEIFRL